MSRAEFLKRLSVALADLAQRERERRRDEAALVVEGEPTTEAAEAA